MKNYTIIVSFKAEDDENAEAVRSEIAQSLEDARDCGELPDLEFDVDDPIEEEA